MFKPIVLSIAAALSFLGVPPAPWAAPGWSTLESKSPEDGSAQIGGALVVGDAALILRCREQKTEAAYSTKDTHLGERCGNGQDPNQFRRTKEGSMAFIGQ
jgi:hypothetical protein